MSIVFTNDPESYTLGFSKFIENAPGGNYSWLKSLREKAFAEFSKTGFPTLGDEDWRFTNLAPVTRTSYIFDTPHANGLSKDTLSTYFIGGSNTNTLVFINGRYNEGFSDLSNTADLTVLPISSAFESHADLLASYLSRYASVTNEAFTALNTAFVEDGALVFVPRGKVIEDPIHLLYVSTDSRKPFITNPRNLIIAEENSQCSIIEQYVSLTDNVYLTNIVTEVITGENSVVDHYTLERESKKSYNIRTLRIEQARNSNISSHTLLMGGALVRNNVHPVLAGEGSDSLINGLYMSNGRQHMDNYMKVEHASPHSDSRQFYNGVLDDSSRGVFHGRIIVHKDAQKTDAKQTNRNLLLTDSAQIDTKPQLEIYADDVKCTHGATIGQLDEDSLFYLRSRGLPKEQASDILLNAFTNETINNMRSELIREYCTNLTNQWFENRK